MQRSSYVLITPAGFLLSYTQRFQSVNCRSCRDGSVDSQVWWTFVLKAQTHMFSLRSLEPATVRPSGKMWNEWVYSICLYIICLFVSSGHTSWDMFWCSSPHFTVWHINRYKTIELWVLWMFLLFSLLGNSVVVGFFVQYVRNNYVAASC